MLIQPDSIIRLIRKCPLDNSYTHTLLFLSKIEQEEYFRTYFDGVTFNKQSYQRYDKGVLTIQTTADAIYDCNYLMFKNTAFGSKWFYAFITSIEYVNNVTSRIYYEIDVMQTWNLDYELHNCFVEREHQVTDNIGDNLVPEKLETGEYVYKPAIYGENSARVTPFKNYKICIMATFDKEFNNVNGGYHGNVYSGLAFNYFDSAYDASIFLNLAATKTKTDGIVGVFMSPEKFYSTTTGSELPTIDDGQFEYIKKNINDIDGYEPHNKKLFTMPYNFILVTNHTGDYAKYGYEYFSANPNIVDNDHVVFTVAGSNGNIPNFGITPWLYKGLDQNYMERLVIHQTPMCSYNIESFTRWVGETKYHGLPGAINDIANIIAGAYTGNISAVTSGVSGVQNRLSNIAYHMALPPEARTNVNADLLNINSNIFGFSIYYCTIRREFAEIIDGFFDRFGYAINRNKEPNIGYALKNGTNAQLRPYWNYIKTSDCDITGGVPADALNKIMSIYNNGITFWTKYVTIGDYSYDNKPRG